MLGVTGFLFNEEDVSGVARRGAGAQSEHRAFERDLFSSLNPPQREAAEHVSGPLLVFAGAGSGKTRVITTRVANLIANHDVPAHRILAVTFTNKAAGEMRGRLAALLGERSSASLWCGTFHSVCARILRQFPDAAGLSSHFVIYDDGDQRSVASRILKDLKLDDRRYNPRRLLSAIHRRKLALFAGDDADDDDAVIRAHDTYVEQLRKADALDFDDLLLRVLSLAESEVHPVGKVLRDRFDHVLVDEFQDTNWVQYRLVRALSAGRGNLCVVGDDDQSIYRWRGADVRNILGFKADHKNARVVKLEQNYRSTANIVGAALGIIRPAITREPKELWTDREGGAPVRVVAVEHERDEAAWVAGHVRALLARGALASDIAVLYRVHAQSRVLEEVFRGQRIAHQVVGGMRFFERAEVKDLLAYLRLATNPHSDVDVLRIINVPSRKLGSTSVDRLLEFATSERLSLVDAIEPLVESGTVGTAAQRSLLGFLALVRALAAASLEHGPRELLAYAMDRTGYLEMLRADPSIESQTRLENLQELQGALQDYSDEVEAQGETPTLEGYLERVSLVSDADTLENAPKVSLMTVHAAKGLEFAHVVITGLEEETFPLRGVREADDDELEEERRLAYVAITRAKDDVVLVHAARRMLFGQTRYTIPSRFLSDLPPESVQVIASPSMMGSRPVGRPVRERDFYDSDHVVPIRVPSNVQAALAAGERFVESDEEPSGVRGGAGMRVRHSRFGAGIVTGSDGGEDPTLTVRFSGWGTKKIKARFLSPA